MRSLRKMLDIGKAREEKRLRLCSAMRSLRTVEFYYQGGYRTVEPFALGIVLNAKADNESLICYQTAGFSDLREAVGWKLYRASDMEDIQVREEQFTGDRPGYDPDNLAMEIVFCCVARVSKPAVETEAPPQEEPKVVLPIVESAPIPIIEPPPAPKFLTHNELMRRFRFAHPIPIPELYTGVFTAPLPEPLPERAGPKIWPATPLFNATYQSVQ